MNRRIVLQIFVILTMVIFGGCFDNKDKGKVESVRVETDNTVIEEGEKITIAAIVTPSDKKGELSWQSLDNAVASVDNGVITGVKQGETEIVAKAGDKEGRVRVTVTKAVAVDSITINFNSEVVLGKSYDISATILPREAEKKKIVWGTSDKSIAEVIEGKLKLYKDGIVDITAGAGDKVSTKKLNVLRVPKGFVRIHFTNKEDLYTDWGLYTWGECIKTQGDWDKPMAPTGTENSGVYFDVEIANENKTLNFIIHKGSLKEYSANRLFGEVAKCKELWIYGGKQTIYTEEPKNKCFADSLEFVPQKLEYKVGEEIELKASVSPENLSPQIEWSITSGDAFIIQNNRLTAVKTGFSIIKYCAGGISKSVMLYVPEEMAKGSIRVHYKRLLNDYQKIKIDLKGNGIVTESAVLTKFDSFGAYYDIPVINRVEDINVRISLTTSAQRNDGVSNRVIKPTEEMTDVYIIQGYYDVFNKDTIPAAESGAFKIANSWGVGFTGEKIKDGFLNMTYDCMKAYNTEIYFMKPGTGALPRAVAVIGINHMLRNECVIKVWKKSKPSEVIQFRKNFNRQDSGSVPINQDIILDITSLLPISGDDIYVGVSDNGSSATGSVEKFQIEVYDDYNGEPVSVYKAPVVPVLTQNNKEIRVTISSITVSAVTKSVKRSIGDSLCISTREMTDDDIPNTADLNSAKYGLLTPTKEEFMQMVNSGEIYIMDHAENKTYKRGSISSIDHSAEKYFPPIGNQNTKGSCVSWSIGYYITTYYEAKKSDTDVKSAVWTGNTVQDQYKDKLMSADFLYTIAGNGKNEGTYYIDNMRIVREYGAATLKTMPIDVQNYSKYGNTAAWREALRHREQFDEGLFFKAIRNDRDIEDIKTLLASGYLLCMSIDADKYANMDSKDTFTTRNYNQMDLNHANTIVGYDDNFAPASN